MMRYRSFDFHRGADDRRVRERGIVAPRPRGPEPERPDAIRAWVVKIRSPAPGQLAGSTSPATEPESAGLRIATILHPTDFSRHSGFAFQVACFLAQQYEAHVVALHVAAAPPSTRAFYSSASADSCAALWSALWKLKAPSPAIRVERRLESGDAATAILRVAQETGAGLIVMGSQGRSGRTRSRMGSVAEHVLRKAPCTVATITAAEAATGPGPQISAETADYWIDLGGEG